MLIIAQALKEKWFKFQGFFVHSQTTNKLVNEAANDSRPAVKIVKNRPLSKPIRLEDLEDCARSQAYKKKMNRFLQRVSWIKRATGTLDLRADQQLSKADVVGAWWCSLRQHNWAQAFFSFSIKMLFSFQLRLRNLIFSKLRNPALKRPEWKLSRNLKISFSWLIVISFL